MVSDATLPNLDFANFSRREAVYCLILGTLVVTVPLILNGAAGAQLHVPFPVVARSGFGFYFSRFVVVVRELPSEKHTDSEY